MHYLYNVLRSIDLFGIHFNFYTDKKREFYTRLGGLLTFISFIISLSLFIYMNYDDFMHNNPISTTSFSKEPFRNVRFLEEKIWVPWRIRDYRSRTLNFTDVFYPIAFYYHAVRNYTRDDFDLEFKVLDFKRCNETSMANHTDSFILDIELSKLFCVEMDYLNMGGGWDTEQINYMQLDLYTCKNGINYNETDPNCSTFEKIVNTAGGDNSFAFDVYFPVVHYQPQNKTKPIFVRYDNFFYHLSRYSNKIDRIYLQQYILTDDNGRFVKNKKNYSHWGLVSWSGDSYTSGKERDIMNEGSSSRLYSLNIYLRFEVAYYNRYYKKFFIIIAEGISIIFGVFSFFRKIAEIFKIASGKKKIFELLFENATNHIKNKEKNLKDLKINQNIFSENNKLNYNISIKNDTNNNNKNFISNNNNDNCFNNSYNYNKIAFKNNINEMISIKIKTPHYKGSNKDLSFSKDLLINKTKSVKIKNFFNYRNIGTSNNIKIYNFQKNYKNSNKNLISFKDINIKTDRKENLDKNDKSMKKKNFFLFPYRYYLFSTFFIFNNKSKNSCLFNKKFINIYYFICQLFDITTYFFCIKDVESLKNNFLQINNNHSLFEKNKININDYKFNTIMKYCLEDENFSILGKIN